MPKAPESFMKKYGKALWLPAFVAVGFLGLNRILANKDTVFRTAFSHMYDERTNVDEEGMRHYKERHIERIKKQVIEEKLQEKRD